MADQQTLTDQQAIKDWAASNGGAPAMVSASATDGAGAGVLRIAFEENDGLEPITWETWFETFEAKKLALIVDPDGRFNKIVNR